MGMDTLNRHGSRESEVQEVLDSLIGKTIKEKELALVALRIEGRISSRELDTLYDDYAQTDPELQEKLRGKSLVKVILGRFGLIGSDQSSR